MPLGPPLHGIRGCRPALAEELVDVLRERSLTLAELVGKAH